MLGGTDSFLRHTLQVRKSKSDKPQKDTELSKKAPHLLPKSSASF